MSAPTSPMMELRPKHNLLDNNFGGYKLSLEPIPSYQVDLPCNVDHVLPSDEQYSFLHLKVFSLQNHLYCDPWDQDSVYYIDKKWRVNRNITNSKTGRLERVQEIWEIPGSHPRKPGHYNASLCFASSSIAVVADGTGVLYINDTGLRAHSESWKCLFHEEVLGVEQAFIVIDSRVQEIEKKIELHCLLLWVEELEQIENTPRQQSGKFQSTLAWVVFTKDASSWTLSRSFRLSGVGGLDYAAFESDCSSLYIASEHSITFIVNDKDKDRPTEAPEIPKKIESNKSEQELKKKYVWQQSKDDIEIKFKIAKEITKEEVNVEVQESKLNIVCKGKTLLCGDFWGRVNHSATTWTLDKGWLSIVIEKAETGLMWQGFVPNDPHGEEVVDPALAEEIHQRLAHLCSDQEVTETTSSPAFNSEQLEDCDAVGTSDVLVRLDPTNYSVSHKASLGGHQCLFYTRLSADEAPALCVRHDVDGCVWQPASPQNQSSTWPINHIGTFHAFGYVQASKQQRKFSVCASDLSYVAICDATRHIYVYRQPVPVEGSLRNRQTGKNIQQTAQQQLVALPDTSEILGAYAGKSTMFVLTSKYLLALAVNQ